MLDQKHINMQAYDRTIITTDIYRNNRSFVLFIIICDHLPAY